MQLTSLWGFVWFLFHSRCEMKSGANWFPNFQAIALYRTKPSEIG